MKYLLSSSPQGHQVICFPAENYYNYIHSDAELISIFEVTVMKLGSYLKWILMEVNQFFLVRLRLSSGIFWETELLLS